MGFPHGSAVKNLPAMWVPSLGWEDPLEAEMAACSSLLAWKPPWIEEPRGVAKSRTRLSMSRPCCGKYFKMLARSTWGQRPRGAPFMFEAGSMTCAHVLILLIW